MKGGSASASITTRPAVRSTRSAAGGTAGGDRPARAASFSRRVELHDPPHIQAAISFSYFLTGPNRLRIDGVTRRSSQHRQELYMPNTSPIGSRVYHSRRLARCPER